MSFVTPSMTLTLPVAGPGGDAGPGYASLIVAALQAIDTHDHSTGKGSQISSGSLNINTDLSFAGFNQTSVRTTRFVTTIGAPLTTGTDKGCIYSAGGELYYNDLAGNQVKLTNAGALNISGSGVVIPNPASLTYSAVATKFVFQSNVSQAANLDGGSVVIRQPNLANAKGVTLQSATTLANDLVFTLPPSIPSVSSKFSVSSAGVMTLSDEKVGQVPVGAVIPLFSNIVGAYTPPASGVVQNGWMLCDGSTVPSGQALTGQATPNLNNNTFIMGAATAGTSGGTNTTTLTTTQLPAHSHTMNHQHTDTFASASHTHDMQHTHQWGYSSTQQVEYSITSAATGYTSGSFNSVTGTAYLGNQSLSTASGSTAVSFAVATNQAYYTTAPLDSASNPKNSTGIPSATAGLASYAGSTASTGSGTAYDSRPQYLSAVYLIRVN